MPAKKKQSETLVGLFILIGLLLLGGLIVQFGRFGDRLRGHYTLTVVFNDASGLIKGSEVRMGGARIGKVAEQPELNEDVKVQVELSIDDRIKIPVNSQIQIASATLLGDKLIVITPPESHANEYIQADARLNGGGPSGLDLLQTQAEKFSNDAHKLLANADATLTKINEAVGDISSASKRLGDTIDKVNNSVLAQQNLDNIDSIIADFKDTTSDWKKASAKLEPTLVDARDAIHSLQKAADGAQTTFAKADERIAELKPTLAEMPRAVSSFTRVAERADNALARATKGDGLLGTLAYDHSAKTDASSFVRNLRQYGILRYRDSENQDATDPRNRFRGKRH